MSNDKMRAEFEKWYLDEYFEGDRVCGLEWLSTEPCGGYRYERPSAHWKTWQASRAAIAIELPDDGIEDCRKEWPERGEKYRYDTFDTGYLYACKKHEDAIEAAGLKVKP